MSKPTLQQTLSTYNYLPSKAILLIHMWITKVVIKNMPIYDIECKVECEMVCFPQVKSVKTDLDTSHHLVAIVEEKISKKMKTAPAGQIIFDRRRRHRHRHRHRQRQHGGGGQLGGGGSSLVEEQLWSWRQRFGKRGGSVAEAAAAQRWQRQRSSGGQLGDSMAAWWQQLGGSVAAATGCF